MEQCLYRLGCLKKINTENITWNEIADFLNEEYKLHHDESVYRKRFKRLCKAVAIQELDAELVGDYQVTTKRRLRELEKQRIRVQEERSLYRKTLRAEASIDAFVEELKHAIQKAEPINIPKGYEDQEEKAIYAMLSDIHYGQCFSSYYNAYNPAIAKQRVMKYADRLTEIGKKNEVSVIYVALLGDLISGNIHQSIRSENRENVISQVIGVSELISAFLLRLAEHFEEVFVTDVAGNHSRLEPNFENALRAERLDALIPWYCKAKLENVVNIKFINSKVDATISVTEIMGKVYVAVHGDFDSDMKTSAAKISQLIGRQVDYFLAGHMHVADMRIEDVGYIRNGSVVSGGDEYTSKKRLFGPAAQVCMLLSPSGVEAVYPLKL